MVKSNVAPNRSKKPPRAAASARKFAAVAQILCVAQEARRRPKKPAAARVPTKASARPQGFGQGHKVFGQGNKASSQGPQGEMGLQLRQWQRPKPRQHARSARRQRAGARRDGQSGLPVPPGFTITSAVCTHYYANGNSYPQESRGRRRRRWAQVGRITGKASAMARNPLLVSVRSVRARASMPGMMDTRAQSRPQ